MSKITPPHLAIAEVAPICFLLLVCVLLTAFAGPVMHYLTRTATDLHQRPHYIERVLNEPAVPGPPKAGGTP
jgi:multicomponent K+:H+ antiporter subunit D